MYLKINLLLLLTAICFLSCKPTRYTGYMGQGTVTHVNLNNAGFSVLGSFTGTASVKKSVVSVKNSSGVISAAKADLLKNAAKAGVNLTGSRTLINVTTDIIQNENRITCTVSAEIIEFQ